MIKIDFLDIVSMPIFKNNQVFRYSGVRSIEQESLSDHITEISTLAYFIAIQLNEKYDEQIDIGLLLEKSLLHDIDEVLTGDIPRSTKYHNDSILQSLRDIADEVVEDISKSNFESDRPYQIWKESKDGKEGKLIKVCDMLVVVKKVITEIDMMGNLNFLKVADEVRGYIGEVRDHLKSHSPYNQESTDYLVTIINQSIIQMNRLLDENSMYEDYRKRNNAL